MKRAIHTRKGITLIELVLYMSIFTMVMVIVFSTVFYLQNIFSDKKAEYLVRTHIIAHLDLIQQHLNATESIGVDPDGFTLYMYANPNIRALRAVHQYIEEGKIVLEYVYNDSALDKKIVPFEYIRLELFSVNILPATASMETLAYQSFLDVYVSWKDRKQQTMSVQEHLYIPNHH